MPVLNASDLDFFKNNGYVVVKQAVPKSNCDAVVSAMWEFLGKNPDDSEEWYTPAVGMDGFFRHQSSGMIEMYHHQAMWDNRQHPRLYQAFTEILGEEKLWVTMDRVNMKPPVRTDHPELAFGFIHWDMDTSNIAFPNPYPPDYVQGVLCLADTDETQGGFQCVPDLYANFEKWVKSQPADRNPRQPNIDGLEIRRISAEAGDLIIWDIRLPHGNGQNHSNRPRLAQYITMHRARLGVSRDGYIASWQSNTGGFGKFDEEFDPRDWEKQHYQGPARLTGLGRKLLGLDSWFEA